VCPERNKPKCFRNIFYGDLIKSGTLFPQCLSDTCYHWVVTGRNIQNLFHFNCGPKFARSDSSWLQRVGTTGCPKTIGTVSVVRLNFIKY